ncbi:O-antigen ligase family protein [Daeguia caeni]|uniref:O-antigen ligase family protein n=1 Tax=Daeguia caeni TaxID=439612 RepID=A0ABV9H6X4_9HYPH
MPFRIGIGPVLLFLYSCIGIYLFCGRHGTVRGFARSFFVLILLYAAWSLGLVLFRDEPLLNNRQIGYTALIAVFAFAGIGMVLVQNPLRWYVLGSRIGVMFAALISAAFSLFDTERFGIGGNEAVFALMVGISAIGAGIRIHNAPAYLPNGPQWLLMGMAGVLLSGTRAVIIVFPFFLAVEFYCFFKRFNIRQQVACYMALATIITGMVMIGPVSDILDRRFAGMIDYYSSGDSRQWVDKQSADIRAVMWTSAARVIAEHPLTGVGGYSKMSVVRAAAGEQGNLIDGFRHVHNSVLDELLNDGMIGLILQVGAFVALVVFLWRNFSDWSLRRALIYFTLVCFSYGMLHTPLLHEGTIAAVMFYLAVMYATASRHIMARRRMVMSEFVRE